MPKEEKTAALAVIAADRTEDHISFLDETRGRTRHFIRNDESYMEVTDSLLEPERFHKDRSYGVGDMNSFVTYVHKYGDSKDGIIFYSSAGLFMFFDEKNRVETVTLNFKKSIELEAFLYTDGIERSFDQKSFAKLIETFPECIEDHQALLPNVQHIKMDATVDFESKIDDTDHIFLYKEKGGTQTAKLPKRIMLILPYFEGSENKVTIQADLEVYRPKSEDERLRFTLSNPRYQATEREAIELEVSTAKKALSKWFFVKGASRS